MAASVVISILEHGMKVKEYERSEVTVEKEERELGDIIKIELGFLLITIIENAVV